MGELRDRLAGLAAHPSGPPDLDAVRRRVAQRRRRRLAARAGTAATVAALLATVVVLAVASSGRTPVVTTSPTVPTTTTGVGPGPTQPSTFPPSPLDCPAGSVTSSTPLTTTPFRPPATVARQYGALYSPVLAAAAGPSTLYVWGPATGCSLPFPSGHTGLDRTTDAGRRFTRVALPEDVAQGPDGIGFGTAVFGYAIGQGGTATNPEAALWVTDTAAATWRRVTLPAGAGIVAGTATPSAAYFVEDHCHRLRCTCTPNCALLRVPAGRTTAISSPLPGFAQPSGAGPTAGASGVTVTASSGRVWVETDIADRLWYSPDRGQHFTTLPLTHALATCRLTAVSPSVLWATCTHRAYRSVNAGRTFSLVSTDQAAVGWDPINPKVIYRQIRPDPVGPISVQRSTNAGRTFGDTTDPGPAQACNYTFTSPTDGLAFCVQQMGMDNGPAGGYGTRDGGRTWQQTAPP